MHEPQGPPIGPPIILMTLLLLLGIIMGTIAQQSACSKAAAESTYMDGKVIEMNGTAAVLARSKTTMTEEECKKISGGTLNLSVKIETEPGSYYYADVFPTVDRKLLSLATALLDEPNISFEVTYKGSPRFGPDGVGILFANHIIIKNHEGGNLHAKE